MPATKKRRRGNKWRREATNDESFRGQPVRRMMTAVAAVTKARPLRVETIGCEVASELTPQALGVTYWLDVAPEGEPIR